MHLKPLAQINEELKRTKFDVAFCKKIKLKHDKFMGFLHFFAKRRKSVEKMVHQKNMIRVTERPRLLNPGKAIAMAICPNNHGSFYHFARALIHV